MSLRFAILGSGSEGNALVVEAGATRVLLDCGFAASETVRRLARLGLAPGDLSGILVTHEHDDHIGGVARLARKHQLPVWVTPGTVRGLEPLFRGIEALHYVEGYAPFCIGDLEVHPYPVPHDAREPAQYLLGDGDVRLGVLTDVGCATPWIQRMLATCEALVLECNHDPGLLSASDYPPPLKQRIAGRFGHLDNETAATLLASLPCAQLRHVVAAHLSQSNNRPDLARAALASVLHCTPDWIGVADQDNGLDWRSVS